MAVTKTSYGRYVTLNGTLAEVIGSLNTEKVAASQVVQIFVDGSAYTAVYKK